MAGRAVAVHSRATAQWYLPVGQCRPVELAAAIVPSADHCEYSAIGDTHSDQGSLYTGGPGVGRLQLGHGFCQYLLGQALQGRMDGAVYRQALGGNCALAQGGLDFVQERIYSVGGTSPLDTWNYLQIQGLLSVHLLCVQPELISHTLKGDVAALLGHLGVTEWGVGVWTGDYAGQRRGLAQREAIHGFAEEGAGGLVRSTDGHSARLAPVDLVQVKSQDLVFAQLPLKGKGQEQLVRLAREGTLLAQKEVFGQLLGQGGAARLRSAGDHVGHQGARDAYDRNPRVLVEAGVLHGQDGVAQMLGKVLKSTGCARLILSPAHACELGGR